MIAESTVKSIALGWLFDLVYAVLHGPAIAPGEPAAERSDYAQVILEARLRSAIARLNPGLPAEAAEEAFRKLTRAAGAGILPNILPKWQDGKPRLARRTESRHKSRHRVAIAAVAVGGCRP